MEIKNVFIGDLQPGAFERWLANAPKEPCEDGGYWVFNENGEAVGMLSAPISYPDLNRPNDDGN